MFTVPLGDGFTTVRVDGNLDTSVPLVVLLHGFGATEFDMTAPLTARSGVAFDRSASFPLYRDEGFHITPPLLPVAGFFADPPLTAVTSWSQALNAAGFSTVSYTQSSSGGLIAPNVTQLGLLAAGPLSTDVRLRGLRIAFVAHSRGGLIARSFLGAAAANPALAGFMGRVTTLITLHSPHLGSGIASAAVAIDGLAARLQAAIAAAGLAPLGILVMLRGLTGSAALAELAVGSPALAAIAAREPVAGVTYHTFGGTSPAAIRLWANVFTPDSTIPLPVPFPLFHWGSTPVPVGAPLDSATFAPAAVLAPLPIVTELMTVLGALAALTPEIRPSSGDVLVSNARAHLPFSATTTANQLNHAEALWDPTLQAQVVTILKGLRNPVVSGQADTRISPYPVSLTSAQHIVTASDAVSGVPLNTGTVAVFDTYGNLALRVPIGAPFSYAFVKRRIRVLDPDTGRRPWETYWPSVEAELPAPYGACSVEIGRTSA